MQAEDFGENTAGLPALTRCNQDRSAARNSPYSTGSRLTGASSSTGSPRGSSSGGSATTTNSSTAQKFSNSARNKYAILSTRHEGKISGPSRSFHIPDLEALINSARRVKYKCKARLTRPRANSTPAACSKGAIGGYRRSQVFHEPFDYGNLTGNHPQSEPSVSSRLQSARKFVSKTLRHKKTASLPPSPMTPSCFEVHRPADMDQDRTEIEYLRRTSAPPAV